MYSDREMKVRHRGSPAPHPATGPAEVQIANPPVADSAPPEPARGAGHPRRNAIFFVVAVALLMGSIDQTMVATALPDIHRDLRAPINWAAWTVTIYSFGRVLILPLAGKLSDQYGRRTIFLGSVALFTGASLCCGLADNIQLLVALRAVQAVGGAAFMPSATGIVVDHFGPARDRAVGLFISIISVGAIIGPVIGGVFVAYWSWRGIFLVNVPIGLVLLVLGRIYLPADNAVRSSRSPLDLSGMALLGAGLLTAMIGIAQLGSANATVLGAPFLACEATAVIALIGFVRHIRRCSAPFIPPRLLHGRGFGVTNAINFLFGATAFGFGALVPLYATQRYGISDLDSGTLLTARALGMIAVGSAATLALRRTGYRGPIVAGFAVTVLGLLAIAASPIDLSPYAWLSLGAGITGVGMGLANPAVNNASLQLAPEHAAAIAGLRGTFRQAGAITAISISTALLARSDNPGITQAQIFAVFGLILLVTIPLVVRVPEHRGTW